MFPVRLTFILVCFSFTHVYAGPDKKPMKSLGLPRGIGAFRIDHRNYSQQTSEFSYDGHLKPLGARFDQKLVGTELAKNNAELAKLVDELNQYGLSKASGEPFGDSLQLGEVSADVKGEVQASILQMAYGLNRYWTVFAGLPYVVSEVKTQLKLTGENNALAIKEELGDLAYEEVQEGLVTASKLTAASISDEIEAKGYDPVDEWHHAGMGDLRVGGLYGETFRLNSFSSHEYAIQPKFTIPTGYVEDPDILTDVGSSENYYAFALGAFHNLNIRSFSLNLGVEYGYNFDTKRKKRVPLTDEALVDEDRTESVNLNPGDDYEATVGLGFHVYGFNPNYKLGYKRHFADAYSGSLRGNYAPLSKNTASEQLYQEYGIGFDTIAAYQSGRFVYPFVISITHHDPLFAKNSFYEDYWQLSLTGFFGS